MRVYPQHVKDAVTSLAIPEQAILRSLLYPEGQDWVIARHLSRGGLSQLIVSDLFAAPLMVQEFETAPAQLAEQLKSIQ
ncbi:MAG: hypothetical protein ACYDEA_04130 [Candidatus Dormibacteria bacterium]